MGTGHFLVLQVVWFKEFFLLNFFAGLTRLLLFILEGFLEALLRAQEASWQVLIVECKVVT